MKVRKDQKNIHLHFMTLSCLYFSYIFPLSFWELRIWWIFVSLVSEKLNFGLHNFFFSLLWDLEHNNLFRLIPCAINYWILFSHLSKDLNWCSLSAYRGVIKSQLGRESLKLILLKPERFGTFSGVLIECGYSL